ncbi:MAG: hypothetical protein KC657_08125 [Myxococcales bacterium]|nr:hypothetical protein [Myxococcales bacterium]
MTLKLGELALLGVTNDGYVAYAAFGAQDVSLEVVSVNGGAPTVLVPSLGQDDDVVVSGGAIGYWTNTAATGLGTFNVWTKAAGAKTNVATGSFAGLFTATADGARIGFGVTGDAAGATDLAVTNASAPSATPVLTGINLRSQSCPPDIGFPEKGNTLLAAYCTGNAQNAADAKVSAVNAAGAVSTLVDNQGAGGVRPFWSSDATGTKIVTLGLPGGGSPNALRVHVVATPAAAPLELDTDVTTALLTSDGAAAVYRTGAGSIRRSTTVANPVKTTAVATGALGLLGFDTTRKFILFRQQDALQSPRRSDVRMIDSTVANAPVIDLVATQTGTTTGFTANGSHALYVTELAANEALGTIKTKPTAGGAERQIATKATAPIALDSGTKVIFVDNPKPFGQQGEATVDIKAFDAAGLGGPTLVATDVDAQGFRTSGNKLVYVTLKAQGGGLFSRVVP